MLMSITFVCVDFDECSEVAGICGDEEAGLCENREGGHECQCFNGYKLDNQGKCVGKSSIFNFLVTSLTCCAAIHC